LELSWKRIGDNGCCLLSFAGQYTSKAGTGWNDV